MAGVVLGGRVINPLAEDVVFSSTAELAAVPFAQGPGNLSDGEEHPGAAAPWLPGDEFSSCWALSSCNSSP